MKVNKVPVLTIKQKYPENNYSMIVTSNVTLHREMSEGTLEEYLDTYTTFLRGLGFGVIALKPLYVEDDVDED